MFSVKRFDAFGSSSGQTQEAAKSAQLDALNDRILKKRKLAADAASNIPSTSASTPSATTSASASAPASAQAPTRTIPSLNIHPSRLNAAPLLRQSIKKAQSGPKEKTRAKQRYLKAKKERRKARHRAAPKKGKKDVQTNDTGADTAALPEEEALNKFVAQQQAILNAKDQRSKGSERSDADSDSETDSSSDSEVGSDSSSSSNSSSEANGSDSQDSSSASSEGDEKSQKGGDLGREKGEEIADTEVSPSTKGLERFPLAGVKRAVDPKLISSLGLPEGLSNRTVVDPTLTRPLQRGASAPETTNKLAVDLEAAPGEPSSPVSDDFAKVAISDPVRQRLEALGVTEWFAVQVSVIPCLLAQPHSRALYRPFFPPRDLCVSAPTGSGKTLAYVVPIVEVLRVRQIIRLRALIVLPTRDLVSQVRATLELIAKGSGLRIATATGHHSFSHEQNQIMGEDRKQPQVDILIATPGRLIDHLDSTPGFTLAHLRFLVIDEADRLLNQSFSEWLRRVLSATETKTAPRADAVESGKPASLEAPDSQAPFQLYSGELDSVPTLLQEDVTPSVQKLLFSATLTRDPAKIAALGLYQPHYITIQDKDADTGAVLHEQFSLPHTLHEHMLITTSQDKPFHFLHLLHRADSSLRKVLCFTKSVESAARLVKLVELFEDVHHESAAKVTDKPAPRLIVRNYSSELRASDRQRILSQFGEGKIDVLVCSDLISRGIDLPSVRHVVSYDAPVDSAKYVHRVGRTARAGKEGDAWTLVEEQEVRHFKRMTKTVGRQTPLDKVKLDKIELEKLRSEYEQALDRFAQFYSKNKEDAAN